MPLEQTLQAETKNATKEKVLSLVNKALEAYNSFNSSPEATPKTEEINHPQETTLIVDSNEISQKTNIELTVPNEVATETQNFNEDSFHFVGSALGTFIIAEQNNILYIIDKHAAHERILYNKIIQTKGQKQELLVPYTIKTQSDD
jgi:DNA mismatch repair ATPase MutL